MFASVMIPKYEDTHGISGFPSTNLRLVSGSGFIRYHQYHAVQKAVEATIEASRPKGDRRCGVVWHIQGSGKSLSMLFYAGQIILHPTRIHTLWLIGKEI
jgi:hypothetical protein